MASAQGFRMGHKLIEAIDAAVRFAYLVVFVRMLVKRGMDNLEATLLMFAFRDNLSLIWYDT